MNEFFFKKLTNNAWNRALIQIAQFWKNHPRDRLSFANQVKNGGSVNVTDYFMISADKVVCVKFTQGGQFQFGDENKEMKVRNILSLLLQPTKIEQRKNPGIL